MNNDNIKISSNDNTESDFLTNDILNNDPILECKSLVKNF